MRKGKDMDFDVASWFASTAALAATIGIAVSFIKSNLYKALEGWHTIAVSLGLGLAAGLAGHFGPWLDGALIDNVVFGLSAGFMASGGWDLVKGLLGK